MLILASAVDKGFSIDCCQYFKPVLFDFTLRMNSIFQPHLSLRLFPFNACIYDTEAIL